MSNALMARRLAKLENARAAAGQVRTIHGTDRVEMADQEAAMIASGKASKHDQFIHFLTIYDEPPVGRTAS